MPKLSSVIEQVSGAFKMVKGQDVDINSASDFGADIVDADTILVDDGDLGSQASTKKSTMSRLWTYISGKITSVFLVDEDNMTSNSDVKFPTQQSVKAYVDSKPDLTVSGTGTIHANNVPTLNQDTTGNAATATSATSAASATSADTAKGLIGGTDTDVNIISDGHVTVKLDADNDESNQGFKITDNSDAVVFSVDEGGIVDMTSAIISSSGILAIESGILRNSTTASNFTISSSRILYLQTAGVYDVQLGNNTNPSVLSVRGEQEVVSVSGDLSVTGSIKGKQIQMFNQSFHDDIGTTKHFMPWSGTLEQSGNAYQEEVAMTMPYGGRIVSCLVRTQAINGSGSLTIGIESKEPGALVGTSWSVEETEVLSVDSTDANHAFNFVFDDASHFDPGDLVAMSIKSNSDLSNATYWYVTTTVEFDLNDALGTSSAEYDTGQ